MHFTGHSKFSPSGMYRHFGDTEALRSTRGQNNIKLDLRLALY